MRWPTPTASSPRSHRPPFVALATIAAFGVWSAVSALRPAQPTEQPTERCAAPLATPADHLHLQIATHDWQHLATLRDRALAAGVLEQTTDSAVPVHVTAGTVSIRGHARLKGDWTDHIDTEQWSLRLELDQPFRGMRRFSIQHPKTRGGVLEWMVMTAARSEGLLAPRAEFVAVAINDQPSRIYYLEEHFSKELLESQARREGPIVRLGEAPMWATLRQYGFHRTATLPPEVSPAATLMAAAPEAYGEARLAANDALNRCLLRALERIRTLQDRWVVDMPSPPLRRAQALARGHGEALDDLFVSERCGAWLALNTVFHGLHGLAWHQLRFYHDPVLDRLEPIMFDTGADLASELSSSVLASEQAAVFLRSPRVWEAAYVNLGRFVEPDWLAALTQAQRQSVTQAVAAMTAAGTPPTGGDAQAIFATLLPRRLEWLRNLCRPEAAAMFASIAEQSAAAGAARMLEIEAWSLTDVPVRVLGFRFGNDRFVPASAATPLLAESSDPSAVGDPSGRDPGSVLLPRDGAHVRLRLPLDQRLAELRRVQAIKAAIRSEVATEPPKQVDIEVVYRVVTESAPRREPLSARRVAALGAASTGRPSAPSRSELLERHPWLTLDLLLDRVVVPAGTHVVHGDLVVPDDCTLHLEPGARLRLSPGGAVVARSVVAKGTPEAGIEFAPAYPATGWGGLLVVGGSSCLQHCRFVGTTGIDRGGWQTTGGVTFHHGTVDLADCAFDDSRGEDACNLFATRFRMLRCQFSNAASDLVDGDFVHGEVLDCRFTRAQGDAIDVSGSRITISGATFAAIGDKAISAGEDSRVEVRGGTVERASIAIAAKDRSAVDVADLTVRAVDHFVLAAFIKKAEFGPATICASGLRVTPRPEVLSQSECTITIDGVVVPTREVDVDALYRQGVLGK